MLLLAAFAAVAVLLAAIGIYGVLAYLVGAAHAGDRRAPRDWRDAGRRRAPVRARRRRADGCRASPPASPARSPPRGRSTLLFGVTATDPATFAAVAGALGAGRAVRQLRPRAARRPGDPMTALGPTEGLEADASASLANEEQAARQELRPNRKIRVEAIRSSATMRRRRLQHRVQTRDARCEEGPVTGFFGAQPLVLWPDVLQQGRQLPI